VLNLKIARFLSPWYRIDRIIQLGFSHPPERFVANWCPTPVYIIILGLCYVTGVLLSGKMTKSCGEGME
jgi:hypothetical protein